MASECLDNLETLSEKGADMDIICNAVGAVYVGRPYFIVLCPPLDYPMQERRTRCVSWSLLQLECSHLLQTNSVLVSFFLAMARNTDTMRTAQRQLDGVLGGERLPDHSDIEDLPYIVAIVKETLRWAPPVPIGTTHRLMEDDVYLGMLISGGATILENIWWE
jgi:hypothetical protein